MFTIHKIEELIKQLSFKFPYTPQEWLNGLYFENYHYHSTFSNPTIADSPSSNQDYANRIKELGLKCIFSGEHGNQGNHFEVYEIAEKNGLKYRHSSEVYWVKDRIEKDSSNCHMCVVAITPKGREELNYILSIANEDGYYYRPRIDLELLFSLDKKDFVITSACVAGWKYEDANDVWLKIAEHFGDHFFFELQLHDTDIQKKLNSDILKLAKDNNIQTIVGLDSHYINAQTDDIKRNKVLEYKKVVYPDEYGWYMDFPDAKEIIERFKKQGILTDDEILISLMNTNIFNSDECTDIKLDRSFKIPCVYDNTTYDERVGIFKDLINEQYDKEPLKSKEKIDGIRYEAEQIIDSGVVDYFLTNYVGLKEAVENQGGVLTTTSRGSMASFVVNKLLGFTTIDRFNAEIPIYPERFLTKERVQGGQMPDCDFNLAEQEPFVKAFRKILGEHSCYPLMAIEKIKEKSAWQLYASVNGVEPQVANQVSKFIDEYNDKLKYIDDEEDRELVDIKDFIPSEYVDIYKKSIDYQGIVINLKVHACGHLLFKGDIRREVGLISAISETTGKRTLVACVEGGYLDSFGYVKDDFLIVDCVGLIKKCWQSIGEEVPTFDELRELIKGDKQTWDIYEKGITCCVNQVEQESTSHKAQKYKMTNLAESSAFIAGIRPGFKSLLPNFLDRKYYTTGEPKIDEILKDSYHYLIYQESIMRVLSYLGLSMGETYDVIKGISKKKLKGEKLEHLKDQLKQGWMDKIGNMDNFNNVWQVINDASRYSFNSPHSLSMGGDSAYIAYFKAHHTAKFYEVAINHYQDKNKKDKIDALVKEIVQFYGYKVGGYKLGDDNRRANIDEVKKVIYPNMNNVKDIQSIVPSIMYELGQTNPTNFMNVLSYLDNTKVNKKSLDILIHLDYFSQFGHIHQLLSQVKVYADLSAIYDRLKTCKQLNKSDLSNYNLTVEEVTACANKVTEKQFKELDNQALLKLFRQHYKELLVQVSNKYPYKPTTIMDKLKYEVELLGYTDLVDENVNADYYIVLGIETNNYGTPFATLYQISTGFQKNIKVDKKWYTTYGLKQSDIIDCAFDWKYGGRYEEVDGKKKWVQDKNVLNEILLCYKFV